MRSFGSERWKRAAVFAVLAMLIVGGFGQQAKAASATRIGNEGGTLPARAVIVKEGPLLHTAQLLPFDQRGMIAGPNNLPRQIEQVMDNLRRVLSTGESKMEDVVKLNIYISRDDLADQARQSFARYFKEMNGPAVCWVAGELTRKEAMVAVDAVAVSSAKMEGEGTGLFRVEGLEALNGAAGAILPKGGRCYVSGQAKSGTLQTATRETLDNLGATLGSMGLDRMNVVQIKAFVQPIAQSGVVQAEVSRFFGLELAPPIVFVEWHSSTNTPIEIELIVADPRQKKKHAEPIEFITPSGMTPSKVFSRVVQVTSGKMIYLSSLTGAASGDAQGQLDEIFATLGKDLKEAGSDFEHLAKATYYVTGDEMSSPLNDIRAKFFNPKRAPAASKATISGVGAAGRKVAVDMIAVTK